MWETITAALSLIAGPAGAVIVLAIITGLLLYGAHQLVIKLIVPGVKKWYEDEQTKFKDIMKAHEDDREIFKTSVEALTGKLAITDQKLDKLVTDVDELKEDVQRYMRLEER